MKREASKMIYVANDGLRKTGLDKCLKSTVFRGPFNKQHDKRDQTLLKFTGQHLYHIY